MKCTDLTLIFCTLVMASCGNSKGSTTRKKSVKPTSLPTMKKSEHSICRTALKVVNAIINEKPSRVLKGIPFTPDRTLLTQMRREAEPLRAFLNSTPTQKQCEEILYQKVPRLSHTGAWLWKRILHRHLKVLPINAQRVPAQALSLENSRLGQASMGEDPEMFPAHKIAMMDRHRIGCKTTVTFTLSKKFAGFITFHYWKRHCTYVPKSAKVKEPSWDCKKEGTRLEHPYYTETIYVTPHAQIASENHQLKKISGKPGKYTLDIWAYNPINEKLFGSHKQFTQKELKTLSNYADFIYCPKYIDNAFNNGCACIGFMKSKITATLHPDPFMMLQVAGSKSAR